MATTIRLTAQFPGGASQRSSWRSRVLWWFMLFSCIGVFAYATRYFLVPTRDAHFSRYLVPLRLHIAGGMGALLAGPWQFSTKLRSRYLNLHRWLGDRKSVV